MSLFKNIFGKKEMPLKSYADFWNWFKQNEKLFFNVVKQQGNIEKDFFEKLGPKLNEINTGYLFLTGMCDENTVELIITVDGVIKNIVFAEELIRSSPKIEGWKFTALKPASDINIEMQRYTFGKENMSFYSNEDSRYPDQIDITIVHDDFNSENKPTITHGVYVFLDNYLGELEFATTVDNLKVISKNDVEKELVPIEKLKSFLIWRQKEFVEKYEGVRHNSENDKHSVLEAELKNGNALVAVINTDILEWDSKASHPWILTIEIKFDGLNNRGMPEKETFALLEEIESKVDDELKDFEGYLYVGRQTANNIREIYFACRDFRKPSIVLHKIQNQYLDKFKVEYNIYSDKYWQTFNRFIN